MNQVSELTSPADTDKSPEGVVKKYKGSKLEPIITKESVNLKVISEEKRLKSSETCPDQLTPTLPVTS